MQLPKTPSDRLDGQRALVTGAGSGLGLAATTALARLGAEVTLAGRNAQKLETAVAALTAEGLIADHLVLDVTDTKRAQQMIGSLPPFPILVNNAGTNIPSPFAEVREEDFDGMVNLNVRAAFFVAQAVAKRLIEERQAGSIINISSQMGHVGGVNRSVYCATKHAMEGWTKSAAWDLAKHAIRVNTICPTFIQTPMTEGMLKDKQFINSVRAQIAAGRLGKPEDIMGAVAYLASPASSLVTGSALKVDGGWTAV